MEMPSQDVTLLEHEQRALVSHLARVQTRCSALIQEQAAEIAALKAQAMHMRAAIIARDSALAWAWEDRAALEAAIPDLPQRATLARRVKELSQRLQELMREKLRPTISVPADTDMPSEQAVAKQKPPAAPEEISELEASIVAADLVICQTGCLSHGAYWRVQDHCKRTGKTCMLVAQPASVRIVRIHQNNDGARSASLEEQTPE
ncbi:DUF2325 domain-containing protein [Herbaspirillum rhizosphaerae]|uniref:DUF2325 domain-containing protein n=1 Tax=Herbaspirillum rhizosphaerae TaxID=346179 RepID=UPI00067AAE59|nr:DUF2325 domain-containing protein [Herbaspirillum rhizosphaerae]